MSSGARQRGTTAPAGRREILRLLLVQIYYMGDVLLATPAVRAARRAFPEARIDFLTGPGGAAALEGNPHLDEVLRLEPGALAQWRLARELRRRRYDAVVDLHSNPRTALLAWASGAPRRIGNRGKGPRNALYTDLASRTAYRYAARQKLHLLSFLGVEVGPESDAALELAIGEAERRWAAETWTRLGLPDDRPVVALSAVSRERFKQWGAERWATVADRLVEAGYPVLLTHGPGEREQAAAVVAQMRRPAAWDHGPTTIRQLGALYQRCALWVGNDGGPKHIAAAAGVPTVTVFRWRFGKGWTDEAAAAPQVAIERAPPGGCDRRCARCTHLGCLEAVPTGDVAAAALGVLGRVGAAHG